MASFFTEITPTVGTAAYIAGDAVGTSGSSAIQVPLGMSPSSGGKVILDSITLMDKSKSHPALWIEFFKAAPSGGTYTDSSPVVYGSGDHANKLSIISILAGDWADLPRVSATSSTVAVADLNMPLVGVTDSLYMIIHSDSGFSLTAGDLQIKVEGRVI